jgi:ribokinase
VGDNKFTKKHIAIGNLNLDLSLLLDDFPDEDSHVFARDAWLGVGGAATNYAVAVAELGHQVSLVARTGGDALKLGLLDMLVGRGIDISRVQVVHGEPMGIVIVIIVPSSGSRTMLSIRGANEGLSSSLVEYDREADVYHLASVKPSIVTSLCSKEWWRLEFYVSYDPGGEVYRFPEGVSEVLSCIDIVFMNEKEFKALSDKSKVRSPRELLDMGVHYVVIKKGSGGAHVYTREASLEAKPPRIQQTPVDVTGAGDAFDAAFNVWLLETGSVELALRAAVAAGAAKVVRRGSSNMPPRSVVEEFMRKTELIEKS